jgi:glucose/arabinose dehydrogenase
MAVKRILFLATAASGIVAALWIAAFSWYNLRGVSPAVLPPPVDIVKVINTTDMPLELPAGFAISIFAKGLEAPRVLAFDPSGALIASIPIQGRVVALPDRNGDGVADKAITVASGLNRPHGLAFRCPSDNDCTLYIAESNRVRAFRYDKTQHSASQPKEIAALPDGEGHNTRTLLLTGEGGRERLLISIGSSCNVCNENDWRRAKVLSVPTAGGPLETFASGLRNAVFMTHHPVTGDVWATEMGRDLLGDDVPPDEVNIVKQGGNYGWPTCYGKNIHDTDFDPAPEQVRYGANKNSSCDAFEPSYIDIPAHSAPLGLAFVPEEAHLPDGQGWPHDYWHDLFVAYHGSWNRSTPTGYKVVRMKLDEEGRYQGVEDFITGWFTPTEASGLTPDRALGRPVDILVQPGGVMYISDDKAGVVYRVTHHETLSLEEAIDVVRLRTPRPDGIVRSPFVIEGEARGQWFFEASFPIRLFDDAGKELGVAVAQAQGDWMTTDFVPFKAAFNVSLPRSGNGTLVLEKANAAGFEISEKVAVPVRFGNGGAEVPASSRPCVVTGCSGEICAEEERPSPCIFRSEFACYKTARCERQKDGNVRLDEDKRA